MKLIFRLRFHTKVGQSLFITGNHAIFGAGQIENAVPLRYLNPEFWQTTIDLPDDQIPGATFSWNYLLRNADGSTVRDWGNDRVLNPASFRQKEILLVDSWNDAGAIENAFYTEPFKKVLLRPNKIEPKISQTTNATHTFKVKAPLLEKNQTLCVAGNCAALGNWSTANLRLLRKIDGEDFFNAPIDLRGATFPVSYKYGVYDIEQEKFVRFEDGENRILSDEIAPDKHTIVNDGFVRLPAGTWKGAGVAIPVFSLRGENSFGVGEFTDLKLLADWCRRAGLKLIQILPINDTSATQTWVDSYPYAAISAFALHPIYLNLNQIVAGKKMNLPQALEAERKKLNSLDAVDYEAVMSAKMKFVRDIFSKQKEKTFSLLDYKNFFGQNKHWLEPYAAFCFLRDKFGTADFNQWPRHRRFNPGEIKKLFAGDSNARHEIELNYFIQFHLHLQLRDAAEYAHAAGVILKGDLAIGVYRHGADVWQQPELFHTDMQAGAPPDAFAAKGQNWGFPTYNWPRMKEDGFAWWKKRFEQMSNYFDAFRIDHVLGFFRIWSSPAHAVEGILGFFAPALPVQISEFAERGIPFDRERLVKPFISDEVLQKIFGGEADLAKQKFLNAKPAGNYFLKPEFATQQQIENHFAKSAAPDQKLREGLFDLIGNVILLEVENSGAREFHFRFGIEETLSFKNFDPQTQTKLKELYVDYFYRRQEDFWRREGLQKLPALKRVTNMLICGEDLGMVPACVPEVMRQLGLLSLEIQRMPKTLGAEFSRPADAPYLSVVTPGTHDMSTIRGWWEEDKNVTRKFYNRELGLAGDAPEHCSAELNKKIVAQHLSSPAMWSIFQLQDLFGTDEKLQRKDVAAERINVPANPKNYWRYRMHLTLEELLRADFFNDELSDLIRQNQR